jgi:hypothetical protein
MRQSGFDYGELRRRVEGKAFPLNTETCLALLDELKRYREALDAIATDPGHDAQWLRDMAAQARARR